MSARAAFLAVALAYAGAVLPGRLGAQAGAPPGVIVGTVVMQGTVVPLPYSVVEVESLKRELFTDAGGRFVLADMPAGRLVIRGKHIGFAPADVPVTVAAGDTVHLRIELAKVVVQLPSVVSIGNCTTPGPPSRVANPALYVLFEQVRQNADHNRLLTRSYPFRYLVQRVQTRKSYRNPAQPLDTQFVDTLQWASERSWRYAPGDMVQRQVDRGVLSDVLMLPELGDFADDAFIANHCFGYGGLETLDGQTLLRVDFSPADRIRQPDIAGAVYLDTASFQIRRAQITLTKPTSKMLENMTGVTIVDHYTDIAPGIPILSSYTSVQGLAGTMYQFGWGTSMTEERMIGTVQWIGARP